VIPAVLRDPAQAEEVAQDVFPKMSRLAFRCDAGKGSATGWALVIAVTGWSTGSAPPAFSARELRAVSALPPGQASETAADTANPDCASASAT